MRDESPYIDAMSELFSTAACWPAWLLVGGVLEGTLGSPRAAPKLFSSRLHPACKPHQQCTSFCLSFSERFALKGHSRSYHYCGTMPTQMLLKTCCSKAKRPATGKPTCIMPLCNCCRAVKYENLLQASQNVQGAAEPLAHWWLCMLRAILHSR